MTRVARLPRLFVILMIRAYQLTIGRLISSRCRFHPSCSEYAVEALSEHGLIKGGAAAAWRVLRCGPWTAGGLDPVRVGHGTSEPANV